MISEIAQTDVATSTGAMVATIDKFDDLTLDTFTAESVQVAVSLILDPGLWFQDPGQARRILTERGTKKLSELHSESLMHLKIAAGGPTAGCNYRTHAGRTDPMCTIVGALRPPPICTTALDLVDNESVVEDNRAETADDEPAPAPAPPTQDNEVWGTASLLRRLAAFEATPSENVLEVRVNDASASLSAYRIRKQPDESAGLPLDIPSTLAAAREWVASHPSPWVRTWDVTDDFEPPDGWDSQDPELAKRAVAQAPRPLLCVKKTDPPQGGVPQAQSASGTRHASTVILSPDDFREMLSA